MVQLIRCHGIIDYGYRCCVLCAVCYVGVGWLSASATYGSSGHVRANLAGGAHPANFTASHTLPHTRTAADPDAQHYPYAHITPADGVSLRDV